MVNNLFVSLSLLLKNTLPPIGVKSWAILTFVG